MREKADKSLEGWSFVPLDYSVVAPDVVMQNRQIGGRSLPYRFGAHWMRRAEDDGAERDPRSVRMWLHITDTGRIEIDELAFEGWDLDYVNAPVVAMRDKLVEVVSVLDGRAVADLSAALVNRSDPIVRSRVVADAKRRRRTNAVDVERVAELYREGGHRRVAEGYYDTGEPVSESTAFRWIKRARDSGALPPRDASEEN